MNRYNLRRLQLHGAKFIETNRSVAITLANGRTFGFGSPSKWTESDRFTRESEGLSDPALREFTETDAPSLIAIRSLMPLARLGQVAADANADKYLSEVGKRERIADAGSTAVKAIGEQAAAMKREREALAGQEVELFERPLQVRDGDLESLLVDRELRDIWRGADAEARSDLLKAVIGGRSDRLVAALLRSPMPLEDHVSRVVRAKWREIVGQRDPERVAAWQELSATVDWADSIVRGVAPVVAEMSGLDRLGIYKAVAPSGAAELFGMDAVLQDEFARRLAAAA